MTVAILALTAALAAAEPSTSPSPVADASPIANVAAPGDVTPDGSANDSQDLARPAAQDTAAQDTDEKKPPTPVHTGFKALFYGLGQDVKHLPSKPNLLIAVVGGGAALASRPIDDNVNIALKSHYNVVNDIFKPGHVVGQTGVMVGLSIVTYGIGRIADEPKASHLGMDLLRAQIIDSVIVYGLKHATHRERPNGSDNLSFPSGHASVTFATATVIERHLGWKMSVLGYGFAAYVASSRLHDNVHWMSDVVFGAAVGTIAGRTVTEHGRNFWTFTPVPVPGGGVALMATRISN
jgi:membrane-associated phospholipid phosphatase